MKGFFKRLSIFPYITFLTHIDNLFYLFTGDRINWSRSGILKSIARWVKR